METSNFNTELLRGFPYLYGPDLAVTKQVIRACEGVLEQENFEEIMTPTLMEYSMIVGESNRPIGAKRGSVFELSTESGEKLALRYENTLPVSLFYLNNFASSPSVTRRFYYVSSHFRNEEETTSGHRLREFRQVGYELIGGLSEENLLVSISTGSMLLSALGLSHSVRVSDVRILSQIFHQLRISKAERSALRSLFDSGDRLAFENFLGQASLTASQRALLAHLLRWKDSPLTEAAELIDFLHTELKDALPHVARIVDVMMQLPDSVRQMASIDLTMVRDATMYSGIIYQWYLEAAGDHEIGGGGEYNSIITSLGGPQDVCACGAAFGLERITDAYRATHRPLPAQEEIPGHTPGRRVF
jgi:histidyl-tRNA synthetase